MKNLQIQVEVMEFKLFPSAVLESWTFLAAYKFGSINVCVCVWKQKSVYVRLKTTKREPPPSNNIWRQIYHRHVVGSCQVRLNYSQPVRCAVVIYIHRITTAQLFSERSAKSRPLLTCLANEIIYSELAPDFSDLAKRLRVCLNERGIVRCGRSWVRNFALSIGAVSERRRLALSERVNVLLLM